MYKCLSKTLRIPVQPDLKMYTLNVNVASCKHTFRCKSLQVCRMWSLSHLLTALFPGFLTF